jgi:DNA-binding transcriptional regulator YhcF (GntR family)
MAIPFYYNPATNELELTADPSPLRDSLGTRFGLEEIFTARETLSPIKSYVDGGRIGLAKWATADRAKVAKIIEQYIGENKPINFKVIAKEVGTSHQTVSRVYNELYKDKGFTSKSPNANKIVSEIIADGEMNAEKIKEIARKKYKVDISNRTILPLLNKVKDFSVKEYETVLKKMTQDSTYKPEIDIRAKGRGMTANFKKAKMNLVKVIPNFEILFNKNINKRKTLTRQANPEKRLSDLVSKQMRKAKKRFKEIGKISLSKADLTFNRAQNTILKLANELINSNPEAVLNDKALLEKVSYRIDSNGNIIKIKPDLTKLIDPKADARFFHLGHGKRVELGGELLNAPANRNAVPFSLNMAFTKDAEKFIEANHNKPEMKSKIDKIIAKAKELKIQLRPDVPKGTFKNASGNPIRFIGYQHNAHPILKVLDVVKTYMPKGLRAPGRLKIPAAILALTTTSAKADSLEPSDKKQEASVLPAVIKDHPILSSAAAVTAAAPKKTWEAVKWAAEKLTPIMTPAGSHVLHGGKYDLTSGQDLSTVAFWKHATDWMGARSRWGNKMIGLKKRLRDIALRGGLPTRFLPLISGAASVAAGPMLIKDAAEWLQGRIDKEGLTGKIEEQSFIGDEAGAGYLMEEAYDKKRKEDAEGMDYAHGGIASLIK